MSQSPPKLSVSRRSFVAAGAASALAFNYIPKSAWGANDRIQVAGIGVGGKGAGEVADVAKAGGKFIALCDVDEKGRGISRSYNAHPDAKRFKDFRVMLEKMKGIDAVTVSTPDHVHAAAASMAMSMGIHAYVQKPLTYTIEEARVLTHLAAKKKLVTQMGNQAHAGEPIRRAVEIIRAGVLGPVREVHAWTNRPIWKQGMTRYPKGEPVPQTLDWELWQGPVKERRAYNRAYLPFSWRGWWDYGTGALGDMACHIMDMPFWALDLGAPETVEAESGGNTPVSPPNWSTITYTFAARSKAGGGKLGASTGPVAKVDQPAVKYVWYDGKKKGRANAPYHLDILKGKDPKKWDLIVVGDEGKLIFQRKSNTYIITPDDRHEASLSVEKSVPRVRSEDHEWLDGIKGGAKPESSFDYSGPLTEMVLLGNVAIRAGKKLVWDHDNMKCKGLPEADQYLRREYAPGFKLYR